MTVDPAQAVQRRATAEPAGRAFPAPTRPAERDGQEPTVPVTPEVEVVQPPLATWRRTFLALDVPAFRNLWFGMLPGTLAMQMGMVTTGYVAYEISGNASAVGVVSAGWGVPMLLFGLVGGVVADRFPKRNVLLLTQAIIGLAAAINAVLVLTDVIQIWHLFLVSALQGTGFAFNMPSRQAFVAQLVPRDRLMNAVALNNSGMNFARVIGPSIAGVLIGLSFVGAGGVFVLMTLMYVYVVFSLLRIPQRGEPQQHTGAGTRPPPLTALRDGLGYVRSNVVVFTLLMLAFVPVLLGMPYQSLMPVFAADVFDVESEGLGLLLTVNGIGALIGSLTIATMTQIQRRGLLQMTLGIVFGVALAGFAFSGSFVVALVALLFVGVASAGFQSLNSTLVMAHADPKYHGRVMSVYMLTFSAMPLAVIPFGILADQVGAPLTIGIGGIMLAVVIGLIGLLHPTYRHIR